MKSIKNFVLFLDDLSYDLLPIRQDHNLDLSSSVINPPTEYLLFNSALIISLISFILKIRAMKCYEKIPL
jgi:hypothetical protein